MRRQILGCLLLAISTLCYAQTNNPTSIYEGFTIQDIQVKFTNMSVNDTLAESYKQTVGRVFALQPESNYSAILASYYTSRVKLLPFVSDATLSLLPASAGNVSVTLDVTVTDKLKASVSETTFRNPRLLPVLYNSERAYLTLRAAASEMVYSNDNPWFGQSQAMTAGNPLADSPAGKGYTAWLEGFGSLGVYGVYDVIPRMGLHIYGGVSYLVSFSAGNELFTNRSRFYGAPEDAFFGIVGGKQYAVGKKYLYNVTYGRKSFTLGDGFLITNTSMNGDNRAALQLNARWAAKELFTASFQWNWVMLQVFNIKPNELDNLNSNTVLRGANLQLYSKHGGILGLSYITVPRSNFRYYLPDGTIHSRKGLEVYNIRLFHNNSPKGGVFFKAEAAYERNRNFDMKAWAYYSELGWNFARVKGRPSVSYRYASFSGDDPDSKSYNRWDALYTGGNGEMWVQGSNMYKLVQNSNERTHRFQALYSPGKKWQMVGQFWLFYADDLNNIGGNPALSTLKSKFYGTEYNLTIKYFHSRHWYLHFNVAYTLPGGAIRDNLVSTKNWLCAMAFARYSF